ncbi:ABC transporter ATP-binding protein [Nocardioides stalactiti]|uniref:ABC transporter ATP-binding protein n=1 Tax=Nocardioides stalactiti TaxID=2755356 RepID=UPI0016017C58|nr:ATP-binding cassette domain-containing protein [Nocardioides stalactiti]
MGTPLIRLSQVGHTYDGTDVFDGVDLDLLAGRTGLIGVNGAGKSTLFRMLATTLEPARGRLDFPGLGGSAEAARPRIGFMPQSLFLPKSLRVRDFLAYVCWLKAVPRRDRPTEIDRVLAAADLDLAPKARVGSLSGGMYRRLLFAQAIIARPVLLMLDEPTAGLDPEQRIRLRSTIQRLEGVDLLLVSSHLIEDLVPLVDRVVMLDDHRVAFDGSVDRLRGLGERQGPIEGLTVYESAFVRLRGAVAR